MNFLSNANEFKAANRVPLATVAAGVVCHYIIKWLDCEINRPK
jgi:hypothetical protein